MLTETVSFSVSLPARSSIKILRSLALYALLPPLKKVVPILSAASRVISPDSLATPFPLYPITRHFPAPSTLSFPKYMVAAFSEFFPVCKTFVPNPIDFLVASSPGFSGSVCAYVPDLNVFSLAGTAPFTLQSISLQLLFEE